MAQRSSEAPCEGFSKDVCAEFFKRTLQARLQPTQLDIYEAHGTGTSLGDPIEVSAVRKARHGG